MNLRTLVSLAVLLPVLAKADTPKTTVTGHHLENTSVGFYGFSVNIPMAYEPYTPPEGKDFAIKTYGDLAWKLATVLDTERGYTTQEIIPFKTASRGLSVSVVKTIAEIPPVKQTSQYLRFMDILMSWCVRHTKYDFIRDTRKIGDTYVGRVGTDDGKAVILMEVVTIPPGTILVIEGTCSPANKEALLHDLDATIATLDFGKRPLVSAP